jgi:hypothetical protein
MCGKGPGICWPGSLLAQMGLLDVPFDLQVKEVYLGKQFFSKETEIGEIMGLTEKNISVRIVRIKSKLKKCLILK